MAWENSNMVESALSSCWMGSIFSFTWCVAIISFSNFSSWLLATASLTEEVGLGSLPFFHLLLFMVHHSVEFGCEQGLVWKGILIVRWPLWVGSRKDYCTVPFHEKIETKMTTYQWQSQLSKQHKSWGPHISDTLLYKLQSWIFRWVQNCQKQDVLHNWKPIRKKKAN